MLLWKVDRTSSNCIQAQISKFSPQLLAQHGTYVDVGNVLNLDLLRSLFTAQKHSCQLKIHLPIYSHLTHIVDQDLQMSILLHVLLDDILTVLILHQITRNTETLTTLTLDLALHVLGTEIGSRMNEFSVADPR